MKDIKIRLNNRLAYVKGLIHSKRHYKYNRAINSLYNFLRSNRIYAEVPNIYSMKEHEEDDTDDELADEGGIIYWSEASNKVDNLIDKFQESGSVKKFQYWNNVKDDLKFCNCYMVLYKDKGQLQARLPNAHDVNQVIKFTQKAIKENLSDVEKRDHFLDNRYIVINGTAMFGGLNLYTFEGLAEDPQNHNAVFQFQSEEISSLNDLKEDDSWAKRYFMTKEEANHLYKQITHNYGSLMTKSAKLTTIKATDFVKDLK